VTPPVHHVTDSVRTERPCFGQDPRIRAATPESIGLIFTKEYWYPGTISGLYRPLTTLSSLFNYSVLGDGPHLGGYHLINLALHDIDVLLVYVLGLMILGGAGRAFALAALWAVHPLLTESNSESFVERSVILSKGPSLRAPLAELRDFREASEVLPISPKASAALSHRLLQAILKDKAGAKNNLADQIDEVVAAGGLPSYVSDQLHAVRNIGDFAAYPTKSTNTGDVVKQASTSNAAASTGGVISGA